MKKLEHPNLVNLEEVVWKEDEEIKKPKEKEESGDGDKMPMLGEGTLYVIIELAELGQVMKWDPKVCAYRCPLTGRTWLSEEKAKMHLRDVALALRRRRGAVKLEQGAAPGHGGYVSLPGARGAGR